jgi:DNA-binding CsgD family transcriptional regulator
VEEEPWGKEKFLHRRRAERMSELREEGKSTEEIAGIVGVSTRTVQRGLRGIGND